MKHIIYAAIATAMLTALPASACQLVCLKTNAVYDGNLGGLSGADAKCISEFGTGWKFPRSFSMITNTGVYGSSNSAAGSGTVYTALTKFFYGYSASSYYYAWAGSYRANSTTEYNCSNWSTNSSGANGGSLTFSYPAGNLTAPTCDLLQPLICCNM